ncbi:MAG: DUF2924 domain-containing protein [Dehalococcoidia bacterium]
MRSPTKVPLARASERSGEMPIENRTLEAGTRLVARHKGKEFVCEVVQTDEGLRYRVDGKDFNSPSSAGREVTGGVAVNGWRFWSLEGTLKERAPKAAKERKPKIDKPAKKTAKTKSAKTVKPRAKKGAKKGAKKATKKAAQTASHDSYGCGVCPETFPTLKAATKHAMTHTQ